MPTYEFTCRSCKHHFDVFVPISKKGSIICSACGSRDLQESFGAVYIGGKLSNPHAGAGVSCSGSCTTCGSTCKTS